MEPRAHHVLIGLFTFLAGLAMVIAFLWLAKAHQQGRVEHYQVVFNEPVRGLARGNAVLYNGIRIGEVVELRLDPADLRKAYARIAIDANIPVRADTQARLVLTGITGVSVIELSGGSPTSPLVTLPADGNDPVIIATPSPLNQLLAGGDTIMTNVSELVISAKAILSPDNIERFANVLMYLEDLMASLGAQGTDFQELLKNWRAAGGQAEASLKEISETVRSARTMIDKEGTSTFEQARKAMASLEHTAASLTRILEQNEAAVSAGTRGLGELGPTLQALRHTLTSIREMAQRLDENPAAYLLGQEKIREFEP